MRNEQSSRICSQSSGYLGFVVGVLPVVPKVVLLRVATDVATSSCAALSEVPALFKAVPSEVPEVSEVPRGPVTPGGFGGSTLSGPRSVS